MADVKTHGASCGDDGEGKQPITIHLNDVRLIELGMLMRRRAFVGTPHERILTVTTATAEVRLVLVSEDAEALMVCEREVTP